jgi:hypothetical protein
MVQQMLQRMCRRHTYTGKNASHWSGQQHHASDHFRHMHKCTRAAATRNTAQQRSVAEDTTMHSRSALQRDLPGAASPIQSVVIKQHAISYSPQPPPGSVKPCAAPAPSAGPSSRCAAAHGSCPPPHPPQALCVLPPTSAAQPQLAAMQRSCLKSFSVTRPAGGTPGVRVLDTEHKRKQLVVSGSQLHR